MAIMTDRCIKKPICHYSHFVSLKNRQSYTNIKGIPIAISIGLLNIYLNLPMILYLIHPRSGNTTLNTDAIRTLINKDVTTIQGFRKIITIFLYLVL